MGPLLTLDTVALCEVQSVLDSCNASFAKIRLAGVVHGTADGADYYLDQLLIHRRNPAARSNRAQDR